jgi:type IX secretion system PorP/SprF family membrane protein
MTLRQQPSLHSLSKKSNDCLYAVGGHQGYLGKVRGGSVRNWGLVVAFFLHMFINTSAQAQDPSFSQFYAAPLYINPALAGVEKDVVFGVNYRSQWKSLGAPQNTGQFTVIMPLSNPDPRKMHRGGIGFSVFDDVAGENHNFHAVGANLGGAYNIALNSDYTQVVAIGAQVGLYQKRIDFNQLQWGSQYDPFIGFDASLSPSLTASSGAFANKVLYPVVNTGVVWYTNPKKSYYFQNFSGFAGVSVSNINQPNESLIENQSSQLPMLYKLHGGAEWWLSRFFNISPNFMLLRQHAQNQVNMGLYLTYKTVDEFKTRKQPLSFTMGSWYRFGDSYIASVGLTGQKYSIGFSYDVNTSSLRYQTRGKGAYELSLVYKIIKNSGIRRFTTPLL